MGFQLRDVEQQNGLATLLKQFIFVPPTTSLGFIVASVDLTTVSDGDELTIANKYNPLAVAPLMQTNDNAGSDLTITIRINGLNQFGDPIEETISRAAGAGSADDWATLCYSRIDKVTVVDIENAAASDTLTLGVKSADTNNKYGLPFKGIKDSSDGIGGDLDTIKVWAKDGNPVSGGTPAFDPEAHAVTGHSAAAGTLNMVIADLALIAD